MNILSGFIELSFPPLLLKKPTDLDLHCLQRQAISGFSRTIVKMFVII